MSETKLRNAVAGLIGCAPDSLTMDSAMNTHPSWDSIAQIDIMMMLAENFGVEISDETITTYSRFDNIIALAQ
jgi:acyl carrier protein